MSSPTQRNPAGATAPTPAIRSRKGPSIVWLIPLIVVMVGGWLIFKTLNEKGPVITLAFKTADGIEAGKTKLRYKNIEIGVVEGVRFSDDLANVLLTAQMAREAETFLRRGTHFWVIRPRLSLRGVSGLSTLVSGAYIEVEPGSGAEQRHFEGLEVPPVVRSDEAGMRITLLSERLGSVGEGSPISYRGIKAGEVLGHELGSDSKSVMIYAFVKSPFDQLIRGNTRFWNVSGVDVSLNSEGLSVRTESMQSVLFGGVAFETPQESEALKSDLDELVFTLYENKDAIAEKSFTKRIRFVMFFDGSVRGLNTGAPVEFKGIKVGSVVDIRLEFDETDTTFLIPVLIELEPERIIARGETQPGASLEVLHTLVDRGLRARLNTGSLLTGQLFIELDLHPNTPIRLVNAGGPYPELPTIPASLQEITASLKGVLENLNKLDFETINEEVITTLQGTNKLVNQDIRALMADAHTAISDFQNVAAKVDARVEPLVDNIEKTLLTGRVALAKIQGTLKAFEGTLSEVDEVLQSDSPLQAEFIGMADQLTETARSIKSFVDLLARNPEAFIFGR